MCRRGCSSRRTRKGRPVIRLDEVDCEQNETYRFESTGRHLCMVEGALEVNIVCCICLPILHILNKYLSSSLVCQRPAMLQLNRPYPFLLLLLFQSPLPGLPGDRPSRSSGSLLPLSLCTRTGRGRGTSTLRRPASSLRSLLTTSCSPAGASSTWTLVFLLTVFCFEGSGLVQMGKWQMSVFTHLAAFPFFSDFFLSPPPPPPPPPPESGPDESDEALDDWSPDTSSTRCCEYLQAYPPSP